MRLNFTALAAFAALVLSPLARAHMQPAHRPSADPRIELFGVQLAGRSRPEITDGLLVQGLRLDPASRSQSCDTFHPPLPPEGGPGTGWQGLDSITVCYEAGMWSETQVIWPSGLGDALLPLEQAFNREYGPVYVKGSDLEGFQSETWSPDHRRYVVVLRVGYPKPLTELEMIQAAQRDVGTGPVHMQFSGSSLTGGQ